MSQNDLNIENLAKWCQANIEGFSGDLKATKFAGGQSNPTFKLETAQRNYVLRRKPMGHLLPGAHAVEREFRVISALHKENFPVPRPYALCEDNETIGSPFYVMEMMDGRIFWNQNFPEIEKLQRAKYFDAMNETLAKLHVIDFEKAGLNDYGRIGGFVERQVKLWSRQYTQDELAGRTKAMDALTEWLPQNLPTSERTSIIHGDFRADNMVFHPEKPEIIAVLDWELSTLGDSKADFCYHLMMYHMPEGLGLGGVDLVANGLPSEEEYIAAYCARTGQKSIENINFYLVFNMFRLAAIIHGIKGRLLRGNASSAQAKEMVKRLDPIAEAAWKLAMEN